mgnify:CR=1 FL=1
MGKDISETQQVDNVLLIVVARNMLHFVICSMNTYFVTYKFMVFEVMDINIGHIHLFRYAMPTP